MAKNSDRPETLSAEERREHPRYRFTATVEFTYDGAPQPVTAALVNLALGGCQVETEERLSLGTLLNLAIMRDKKTFRAEARAVAVQPPKHFGLLFTAMEQPDRDLLQTWLAITQEAQWLAAHRRRSQRVFMRIPVRITGNNTLGTRFSENAFTEIVSAHGALILLEVEVTKGQRLVLVNPRTGGSQECTVVHFGEQVEGRRQVGLEFALANREFWQIAFPPLVSANR